VKAHSPGPWHAHVNAADDLEINDAQGRTVCKWYQAEDCLSPGDPDLIIAAPDLLKLGLLRRRARRGRLGDGPRDPGQARLLRSLPPRQNGQAVELHLRRGRAPRGRRVTRRLRLGYLSPDFRVHSVAYFFEPILRAHDRAAVEVFCYHDSQHEDDVVTRRLQGLADHWRNVGGSLGHALQRTVRADELDVLVELAGHTPGNRLELLRRERLAPLQVSMIGHPEPTGLDLKVTDAIADPPGAEAHYGAQRLLRLEGGAWAYRPALEDGPPVADPPSCKAGYVTFGCFGGLGKVSGDVLVAWANILQRVPGSRLLVKAFECRNPDERLRITSAFLEHGIAADRIELLPWWRSHLQHLQTYGRVDIALDTFPYNGTTTTCEALWMGVPVVALRGDRHAGRVGASLLERLGLDDLVADDVEGYVGLAAEMAVCPMETWSLRGSLRDIMRRSALMDGRRVAAQLERAFGAAA
jgi:protein O-GlcNAc transferase